MSRALPLPCGCTDPGDHVTPSADDLDLAHGERAPGCGNDPPFIDGNGDPYCICGHPHYMTCPAWPDGGIAGWVLSRPE